MKKLTKLDSALFSPLCEQAMSQILGGYMDCSWSSCTTATENTCNGDLKTVKKDDDGNVLSTTTKDNPCNPV